MAWLRRRRSTLCDFDRDLGDNHVHVGTRVPGRSIAEDAGNALYFLGLALRGGCNSYFLPGVPRSITRRAIRSPPRGRLFPFGRDCRLRKSSMMTKGRCMKQLLFHECGHRLDESHDEISRARAHCQAYRYA